MMIENAVGPLPKKIVGNSESTLRSSEGVSSPVESKPDEEQFSKLLKKEVSDEEPLKPEEGAMPIITPEAPPVPVHVFNFELLVRERKASLSAEAQMPGKENKLSLNGLDRASDSGETPALLADHLSGNLEQQVSAQKADNKKNKFHALEFNLLETASQGSPDPVTVKSTVSMGAFDSGDRAAKGQDAAPTAKLTDHPVQLIESGLDSPMASGRGAEIGMSTGVEAFPPVEKSSFWVANGIQNLAMTLDGQGDAPIEIKISLSGLDARVDIRTDHAALRQMIEGSVQDIKDQLHGEGLSLSAVSVGAGFQGKNSEQTPDGKNRSAPDSPYLKEQTLDLLSPVRLPAAITGRKLSVFV